MSGGYNRWGGLHRRPEAPTAGCPTSLPKIKIREEGKQMEPLAGPCRGHGYFPSFLGGIPTLLSHREDKQGNGNLQPSRPLEVHRQLEVALTCTFVCQPLSPPHLLSPLVSKTSFMENLEFGTFFRFQRSYCSTSCYLYLGVI